MKLSLSARDLGVPGTIRRPNAAEMGEVRAFSRKEAPTMRQLIYNGDGTEALVMKFKNLDCGLE